MDHQDHQPHSIYVQDDFPNRKLTCPRSGSASAGEDVPPIVLAFRGRRAISFIKKGGRDQQTWRINNDESSLHDGETPKNGGFNHVEPMIFVWILVCLNMRHTPQSWRFLNREIIINQRTPYRPIVSDKPVWVWVNVSNRPKCMVQLNATNSNEQFVDYWYP